MNRFFRFLSLFFWALVLSAHSAENVLIIRLSEKATVVGPQIKLGEVADIIGGKNGNLDRVRQLELAKAAPVGNTFKLSQDFIKIVLRREGYSLQDFVFEGGQTTEVLTQSRDFEPSDLLPEIKKFVLEQTKESSEDVDVKLAGLDKKILLPAGEVKATFQPSFSGRYEGSVLLTTNLEVDGRLIRVLPLRVTIDVFHPAVVTTRKVEKGEKFDDGNIALVRTPTSRMVVGCFRKLAYVLGRTASVPLTSGTVLRVSEIYDPPVIRHGQIVQAIVRKGNVELMVDARAIEDAKAGDSIRVENTNSHKVLNGKVLDEKTVLIDPEKQ